MGHRGDSGQQRGEGVHRIDGGLVSVLRSGRSVTGFPALSGTWASGMQGPYREMHEARIPVPLWRVREPGDFLSNAGETVEYVIPVFSLVAAVISDCELTQPSQAVMDFTDLLHFRFAAAAAAGLDVKVKFLGLVEDIAHFDIEAEGLEDGVDCHVGAFENTGERLGSLHGVVGVSMAAVLAEVSACLEL